MSQRFEVSHATSRTNRAPQRLIDKRRRKLRKRALKVGLPRYAEKPAHFEARLRRYLRQWA